MNSSNLVKVIAAFVAGIVVAVGSPFFTSRRTRATHSRRWYRLLRHRAIRRIFRKLVVSLRRPLNHSQLPPQPKPFKSPHQQPKPRKVIPAFGHSSSRRSSTKTSSPFWWPRMTVPPAQAEPNPPANPYTAAPPPQPAVAPVQQAAPAALAAGSTVRPPRTTTIPSGTVIADPVWVRRSSPQMTTAPVTHSGDAGIADHHEWRRHRGARLKSAR